MAIDPTTTTTIRVGQLGSAAFNSTDLVPHEVSGVLKKGTLQDLATFIGSIISVDVSVGFRAVQVNDGETLPATDQQEFILVGPGTYPNVGGGATITTTGALNALVSNGVFWFIGVEIPIEVSAIWGDINGVLSDQTDLQDALDLKANLVGGKVPASELPSYVDDVVEVANYAALPTTGEVGKIYVTLDNNKIYRWSGSVYIEIAANSAVWGSITGTLSSQTDLVTALNLRVPYTGATSDLNLGTYDVKAAKYWMLDEVNSNYGSMHFTDGNYHIEDADGHKLFVIEDGFMQLHKTDTIQSNLYTSGLTAIRDHYLPDASGTFALTSQLHNAVTLGTANGLSLSTQVLSLGLASTSANGALSSTDWNTFNGKQSALNGTGFVKISGTTISYDNSTYALDSAVVKLAGEQTITGVKTFSNMPILSAASGVNGQIVYADASNQLKTITNFKYNDSTGVITTLLGNLGSNAYTSTAYQPLLTNPITGTGTTNYIPKFTGSTALGNSLIFDNGTSIGIGTTSPAQKLDVFGISRISATTPTQEFYSTGNADVWGSVKAQASGTGTGASLVFSTKRDGNTATDKMIITQSGNVGIGTTSPSQKLDVNGNANITGYLLIGGSAYLASGNSLYFDSGVSNDYAIRKSSSSLAFSSGGTFTFSGGNVGIGTTSPSAKLNVSGDIHIGDYGTSATRVFETRTSTNLFSITTYPTNADGTLITYSWANGGQGPLRFGNASSVVLALTASGNVLVPTLGTGLVYSNNGTLTSTNPSDSRLKDNIVSLNYGLNEILKLRPVSYNWKNDEINQGKQFGFIAQEVQEVMPELVKEFETEDGERLGLDKEGIYAALVNAIQEQQKQIEELKKLIK